MKKKNQDKFFFIIINQVFSQFFFFSKILRFNSQILSLNIQHILLTVVFWVILQN